MLPVDEIRLNFNPASLVVLNGVLGFLMFGIALDTRVADFKRVLRMPGAMAVGIAAQFIVLPAVTFVLTLLLKPGPSIALGMILVACCPPGNVSNILTHRAGGNVALSVSMTAISNALAIVLMPLNFAFWGGMHPTAAPLLRSIALDPLEMAGHIVVIIGLPFVLGILCAEKLPRLTQRVNKPVRIFSFLCLIGFIVGAVAGNWRYFLDYVGLVLLAVALHDALAFGTGYACARLSGLPDYDRRAVSIEVSYGLAQGLGQFGFLFLGLQLGMTAGMASVVMQTQAFFTLLLAAPLLGERAKPWQWGGLLLAFGGLMTIGLAHGEGPGQMTLAGFVLTLGAAFMWAVSNLVARRAAQAGAYAPFPFIVWSSVVPIGPFFALALWSDGAAAVWAQLQSLNGTGLLAVAYLAFLATLLAYTLWTQLLQRHAAGRVTPFSLLVPVVGLWAAYAFLGETPAPLQWAGAVAVLCGLVVNQVGGLWWARRAAAS